MAEQAVKEPSMEEILSTIRRIISEDGDGAEVAASAMPQAVNDVASFEDAPAAAITSEEEANQFFDDLENLDASDADLAEEEDAASFVEEPPFEDVPSFEEEVSFEASSLDEFGIERPEDINFEDALEAVEDETLTADADLQSYEDTSSVDLPMEDTQDQVPETDMAATAAYQETVLTEDETADAAAGALGKLISSMKFGEENTIEGLVREMLKPMIKDWLDANLPQIVEQKVEAEVQRIAKMVR